VAKDKQGRKANPVRLTLGERIEKLEADEKAFSHLTAVRWIGNQAAHTADLTRNNIFDALDILDSILEHLFNDHGRRVKELVAAVNRQQGAVKE
jgi:hypothetical protein